MRDCDTCVYPDIECYQCVYSKRGDDYREVIDHVDSTKYLEKESIKCKYYISKKED